MKFGIISTGNMASTFAGTCAVMDNAEVVAVASRSIEKAVDFKKKYLLPKAYGSYDELYKDPEIDAVYVATPHNFHKKNCLDALNAGKHVLCEKALALSVSDAAEIFQVAKNKGLFVMEAVWTRFLPTALKAKQWVDNGRIGKVKYMDASSTCYVDEANKNDRRLDRNAAGGALYELGIYGFYMTQWFNDADILDCNVLTNVTDSGVDGYDLISLRLSDNVLVSIRCAITYLAKDYVCIYGEKGHVVMTPHAYCPTRVELYNSDHIIRDSFEQVYDYGLKYEIMHFVQSIQDHKRESEIIPCSDVLKCCKFYEAVRNKNPLHF